MALDKTILGQAMYDRLTALNNKTPAEIGNIEDARLTFLTDMAYEIINHFKSFGEVNVTVATTGTATAQTGTGTGTIE